MMEEQSLYAKKVEILSRLIKETTLTLEEALLLLKEEELDNEVVTPVPYSPWTTNTPNWPNTFGTPAINNPWFSTSGSGTTTVSNLTFSTSGNTAVLDVNTNN